MEAVPVVVEAVPLDHALLDAGAQELEVAEGRRLVEHQLPAGRIVVAAAEGAVPLYEVGAVEWPMVVALAGVHHTLLHRLAGSSEHVIPGEFAAADSTGQLGDLRVGPSELTEQCLVEVERTGLGVLRDAPDLALVPGGVP